MAASVKVIHSIGILFTVTLVTWLYLTGVFVTMPAFYKDLSPFYYGVAQFVAIFIALNTLVNLALTRVCDSFYNASWDSGDDTLLHAGWVKCTHCVRMAPPRSHHCAVCQRCVLKRDHHCFMTGTCIGLRNQRYFTMFLVYCDVGLLYSSYMSWHYIYTRYGMHPLSRHFYHFIPPFTVTEWLLGYLSSDFVNVSLLGCVCFTTVIGTMFLAGAQIVMIVLGTTGYEYKKGVRKYSRGVYENMKEVFGPYWLLHLLLPLPYVAHTDRHNMKYL